jgi:hypothetical protein
MGSVQNVHRPLGKESGHEEFFIDLSRVGGDLSSGMVTHGVHPFKKIERSDSMSIEEGRADAPVQKTNWTILRACV